MIFLYLSFREFLYGATSYTFVLFQPEFGLSSFLKVDIKLIIDDGRNSNHKIFFNLRDVDDDMESLYQTRAKEWFPFSLTMKVPGLDPHQTVQVQ